MTPKRSPDHATSSAHARVKTSEPPVVCRHINTANRPLTVKGSDCSVELVHPCGVFTETRPNNEYKLQYHPDVGGDHRQTLLLRGHFQDGDTWLVHWECFRHEPVYTGDRPFARQTQKFSGRAGEMRLMLRDHYKFWTGMWLTVSVKRARDAVYTTAIAVTMYTMPVLGEPLVRVCAELGALEDAYATASTTQKVALFKRVDQSIPPTEWKPNDCGFSWYSPGVQTGIFEDQEPAVYGPRPGMDDMYIRCQHATVRMGGVCDISHNTADYLLELAQPPRVVTVGVHVDGEYDGYSVAAYAVQSGMPSKQLFRQQFAVTESDKCVFQVGTDVLMNKTDRDTMERYLRLCILPFRVEAGGRCMCVMRECVSMRFKATQQPLVPGPVTCTNKDDHQIALHVYPHKEQGRV